MFYRVGESSESLSLLCEAADIAAGFGKSGEDDLADIMALCSAALADYYSGRRETKPYTEDLPNLFRDPGISGLLEYLLASEGASRETVIPLCLECVDLLNTISDYDFEGFEDYDAIEDFVLEVISRLLLVAEKFPDTRDEITRTVWDWISGFVNLIVRNQSRVKFNSGLFSLMGTLTALTRAPASVNHSSLPRWYDVAATILGAEQMKAINGNVFQRENTYPERQYSLPKVVQGLFDSVRHVLVGGFLHPGSESGHRSTWETLFNGDFVSVFKKGDHRAHIHDFFELCWRSYRIHADTGFVQSEYEESPLLPVMVQCAVLCALHVPELQDELIDRAVEVLRNHNANFVRQVGVEVYIACMEGLAIIMHRTPFVNDAISSIAVEFLTTPAPAFTHWGDDHTSVAALRQGASNLLLKSMKVAIRNDGNAVIPVESFLEILATGPGQPISERWNTPFNETQARQNSVVALATVAPLLETDVVNNIITSGYEPYLKDTSDPLGDLVFESLGSIALTSNPEVLHLVMGCITRHHCQKSTKLRHTIARGIAKEPQVSAMYLQETLIAFRERAMKVPSPPVSELREMAWVASVLCEEHRPLSKDDRESLRGFRDFWICAVMCVMNADGSWPRGWQSMLRHIALRTPAMTFVAQGNFLQADLEAHCILKDDTPEVTQQRIRETLISIFPDRASDVKSLSFRKCAYLLGVRALEVSRGQSNSFIMLEYLTDERLYNDDVYMVLQGISEEVLNAFFAKRLKGREGIAAVVEDYALKLLYTAACRLDNARRFAVRTLHRLLAAFPGLLWNRKAVSLMLDLLQYLDIKMYSNGQRKALLQDKVGVELSFMDVADLQAASKMFFDCASKWMSVAVQQSSSETMGMIQGYMLDLHTNFPELALGQGSDLMSLLGQFCSSSEIASLIVRSMGKQALYFGEVKGMLGLLNSSNRLHRDPFGKISESLRAELRAVVAHSEDESFMIKLHPILHRAAALVLINDKGEDELLELICWTPITTFTPDVMDMAISVWDWMMSSKPELAPRVMGHLVAVWETTTQEKKGLYQQNPRSSNPFYSKMTYSPSRKPLDPAEFAVVHLSWIRFLLDRFKSARVQSNDMVKLYLQLYQIAHEHIHSVRPSWAIGEAYFLLLLLGTQIGDYLGSLHDPSAYVVWTSVLDDAIKWFEVPPMFGRVEKRELDIIITLYKNIRGLQPGGGTPTILESPRGRFFKLAWLTPSQSGRIHLQDAQQLLLVLLENEIQRLAAWLYPLGEKGGKSAGIPEFPDRDRSGNWEKMATTAWSINPRVAVQMSRRFSNVGEHLSSAVTALVNRSPSFVMDVPEALPFILKSGGDQLRFILFWKSVPPVSAVSLLGQQYKMQPWILQYAVRVLEYFPVDHVFFYIPQMVQALRYDTVGYIEHFILYAAKTSQLFAHQIIWNMNANMYKFNKEGVADAPDSLKPTLERIQQKIIASLSGSDKRFYEREFRFFSEVTGISGKLKPLVESGASKPEKKKKIDEEIAKIKVEVGVYLPTNPESIVVDIDYASGRPLQSHAKAPFMATFKVQSADENEEEETIAVTRVASRLSVANSGERERWMSSIFKVGDDCRQDLLALQLISIFKSVFEKAGLDLYLFPYRVVATAPGCGVIEVIPRSISRDMMGREQVNNLHSWFLATFGKENSLPFRKAQYEFIRSLAAYSVILYILQIKDRHNGNIMYDRDGHMVHIDFGFMLSIAPGGGILEVSPFKLTAEMVQVMGGDTDTPQYQLFRELCVKAYLACRPYAEEIVQMVSLMMDSGLPCFKGEGTTRKLRERFHLDKTERQAAEFMLACIRQSHENTRSGLYDKFQYLQNGIPY